MQWRVLWPCQWLFSSSLTRAFSTVYRPASPVFILFDLFFVFSDDFSLNLGLLFVVSVIENVWKRPTESKSTMKRLMEEDCAHVEDFPVTWFRQIEVSPYGFLLLNINSKMYFSFQIMAKGQIISPKLEIANWSLWKDNIKETLWVLKRNHVTCCSVVRVPRNVALRGWQGKPHLTA